MQIAGPIGAGSIGLSFAVAALVASEFLNSGLESFTYEAWVWMSVGGFNPGFTFYLDGLSMVMMLIITGVDF